MIRKFVVTILLFLSILALFIRFGVEPIMRVLGAEDRSGVRITALHSATVFINGKEVGKTPYQDENLTSGEYTLKVEASPAAWMGKVKLYPGTLSVVNRELSLGIASSSGEVLTLTPGKGVIVISTPGQSDVEIDGKQYGKTPLYINDITSGEHTFLISRDSYLKRMIKASLPEKMLLRLDVDLAISEADLGGSGTNPQIVTTTKVLVKKNSTGFLRVREKPSTAGKEIGRISSGESLILLEEQKSWAKVRLPDGKEGYVSSVYIQKQKE